MNWKVFTDLAALLPLIVVCFWLAKQLEAERALTAELKSQTLRRIIECDDLEQAQTLASVSQSFTAEGALERKKKKYWR